MSSFAIEMLGPEIPKTFHLHGNCSECSRPIDEQIEMPQGNRFGLFMLRMLESQQSGASPMVCDQCVDREAKAMEDERIENRRNYRYEQADIPLRFRGLSWDQIEKDEPRREAIEELKKWSRFTGGNGRMSGVYLYGDFGRGKTMIMAAAVCAVIENNIHSVPGPKVRWIDCARLMTDLRGGFDSASYKDAMKRLERGVPGEILVLDDIDKMPASDHQLQPLYTAINEWVNLDAPILISANRSLDELVAEFNGENNNHKGTTGKFGDAIGSRIIGQCVDIEVGGRDRRLD